MTSAIVLAAVLAAAGVEPQAQPAAEATASAPAAEASSADAPAVSTEAPPVPAVSPAPKLVLPKGTMVRLMLTKEVNSRDNHPGDRFVLRVDEEVKVGGVTVIPVGAKGWGEIVDSAKTGGIGKSGKINARLLYVEASGQRIELDGQRQSSGGPGAGNVVAGVVAFGPFGLFMKGGNASLKAGEILNGYTLSDAAFEATPKSMP